MTAGYESMKPRFAASSFRSRFRLREQDRSYIVLKGWGEIRSQARRIIRERLAPAEPENDGRQTPMRGHVVFIAQHATATCCRGCLFKWHSIVPHKELTEDEIEYVVEMIFCWLQDHAGDLSNYPQTPDLF
ncbi:MAG: DUF4186 domain-containing protein [Lentisphaeria bacterium]|nr:DUF4186 domain-containing protein [Lentisphaeria bacterium]